MSDGGKGGARGGGGGGGSRALSSIQICAIGSSLHLTPLRGESDYLNYVNGVQHILSRLQQRLLAMQGGKFYASCPKLQGCSRAAADEEPMPIQDQARCCHTRY